MDNRIDKKGFILLLAAFYMGVMLLTATPGEAKWWDFGRQDNTPEFTSIRFNSVSVENVDERITLAREDLVSGELIIRGQAELGQGVIGKVEISLDGGETWQKAVLGDRGMFTLEFKPELEREYDFRIKALSTAGKASDLEDHSFTFLVGDMPNTDNVKTVFNELLRLYMAEDQAGFMRLVHPDFEGDLAALEDAVSDDFLFFDNIRIEPNITRIVPFDGNYELYFTFNRQVQVAKSGQLLKDSAASSMTFARGSGFLLSEMAAPLIFGVSNPGDVATNVTEESIGSEVLGCNNDGDCGLAEQGDDTESGGGSAETATLDNGQGIFLATGALGAWDGDIIFETNIFFMNNNASWVAMANNSFDTATQAPAGPYDQFNPAPATTGSTFAVKLGNGTYAIVEVDQLNAPLTCVINYKYPVSGP
ncbi:MAG: hypothetical protein L3J03_00910 [Desulfobacterales bacterium]|nr:hypothetical protein [Desulfobacterales bacterium]